MKDLIADLLGLVGATCLVIAGWMVAPPLGFAVLGIVSLLIAAGLARIEVV